MPIVVCYIRAFIYQLMLMVQKLTPIQRQRVDSLEIQLKNATAKGDLESAKRVIIDLQPIYTSTGNDAKLMQAKIRLYEASMDLGMLDNAVNGLCSVRIKVNKNTRTFLEASVLLAVCYLRLRSLDKAEPIIRDVLVNDSVIKSNERRKIFRTSVIERFDEEGLLFALKEENQSNLNLDYALIEHEAATLIRSNANEADLFENIGRIVPGSAKNVLLQVDQFSKKQLPSAERIALPSGTQILEDKKVGKTLFNSVKRVIYKSVCDKDSDINKGWVQGGLTTVTSLIAMLVADTFHNLNIIIRGIIVTTTALIIRLGIAVFCEHHKPADVMELR
jgi:hypothetical protein